MSFNRKPDWILKVQSKKKHKHSNRIGAGWNNPKGHINIIMDLGSVLMDSKDLTICLFPNDYKDGNDP